MKMMVDGDDYDRVCGSIFIEILSFRFNFIDIKKLISHSCSFVFHPEMKNH